MSILDTDAVEAVPGTGNSLTLSSEQSDFYHVQTKYLKSTYVNRTWYHRYKTVEFTVINDHDKRVIYLLIYFKICDSIHVPTLNVRLI